MFICLEDQMWAHDIVSSTVKIFLFISSRTALFSILSVPSFL